MREVLCCLLALLIAFSVGHIHVNAIDTHMATAAYDHHDHADDHDQLLSGGCSVCSPTSCSFLTSVGSCGEVPMRARAVIYSNESQRLVSTTADGPLRPPNGISVALT